ncbi:AbrB/MazE/SpoVT family DNA-binding domain-containing protein [Metabacillus idriensis]|uniref:AbrB/MazE/SpoVT family DNA-binding domain-containing protein n=1 Tax=Metabacillus idriensis TaxID=324768 RepID=UPI00174D2CF2|nr:AbrB/MazE/SpoVT family DNA-binding domain-containing protein [Metabacillus idriensis]
MLSYIKEVKLRKNGQINIPSEVRNEFNLKIGNIVKILSEDNSIILTKDKNLKLENESVISQRGSVSIPIEIRKIKKLSDNMIFQMGVDKDRKRIYLVPKL